MKTSKGSTQDNITTGHRISILSIAFAYISMVNYVLLN